MSFLVNCTVSLYKTVSMYANFQRNNRVSWTVSHHFHPFEKGRSYRFRPSEWISGSCSSHSSCSKNPSILLLPIFLVLLRNVSSSCKVLRLGPPQLQSPETGPPPPGYYNTGQSQCGNCQKRRRDTQRQYSSIWSSLPPLSRLVLPVESLPSETRISEWPISTWPAQRSHKKSWSWQTCRWRLPVKKQCSR